MGGGGDEASAPTFKKIFSILPSKAERKSEFTLPRMNSKNDFYLKSSTP
jgi:hypothetical protein